MADAVIEAKSGVLETAYQEDQTAEDITMKDVMINVEQQAAEYEKKRRQKYEERRAQMQKDRRGNYNGERRVFRKDGAKNVKAENAEAPAAKEATTKEEA